MKKYLLLTIAGIAIATGNSQGQTFKQKYFKEGSYIFDDMQKIRQAELFTTYKSEFGLGANDEMRQTNNVVTIEGKFTTKYVLFHKGIPVEGSMMNVIGDKGIAQYANGFLITGLSVDKDNVISKEDAIEKAIDFVNAQSYLWEDDLSEQALRTESEDSAATYYPNPTLIITKKRGDSITHISNNYKLCYQVEIFAKEPAKMVTVFVNANDGTIFDNISDLREDYSVTGGHLWTWYNGEHWNLNTTSCGVCFNFWLKDQPRNIQAHKYDFYYPGYENKIKDGNNNWVENDTKTGATTQWSLARAWDYYINRHGRWGTDYAGRAVWAKINTPTSIIPSNAAWKLVFGKDFIYVRPDNGHSAAMLDVIAHEYTHGMIAASSNLGVLGDFDSRSLAEAYSDIFGMRIEGYSLGSYDWTFAEHMETYQRNFADPHTDFGMIFTNNGSAPGASASKYLESGYWSSVNPHANGGILRKWFHLLSNGGTFNGNTVQPLGIETADDIAYTTFNWWLWSNVQYPEAASQTVLATKANWGKCSQEHKQVVKALRAVGFNIPNPLCFKIQIDGPVIIEPLPSGKIIEWKTKLNEIEDQNGTYEWQIPADWNATPQGNRLILNDHRNTNSQKLSVTYTASDNSKYHDTIIVHFSDVDWQPTNNMPNQQVNKPFEELSSNNGINVYPNPASNKVSVSIDNFQQMASIEIYDINGKLIKEITTNSSTTSIDINDFANGIYLLKIKAGEKTFNQKLSIIH